MDTLDANTILLIFSLLHPRTIFKLRRINKILYSCSKDNNFWKGLYDKHFGCPVDDPTKYDVCFWQDMIKIQNGSVVFQMEWAIRKNSMILFQSILQDNLYCLESLFVKKNTVWKLPDTDTQTVREAAVYGRTDMIKLLPNYKISINNLFCIAVANGHVGMCKLLVADCADINKKNEWGKLPLELAIEENKYDVVKYLCSIDVDTNIFPYYDYYPSIVIQVLIENRIDILKLFISSGAKNNYKYLLIHSNAHKMSFDTELDLVKILIASGMDIYELTESGSSMLHLASEHGRFETMSYLLKNYKFDLDLCDTKGLTPLFYAVNKGCVKIIDLLISKDSNVHVKYDRDQTLLHTACEKDIPLIVKLLLFKCVNVDAVTTDGLTPLYIATEKGHGSIVQILCENGADIDIPTNSDLDPIAPSRIFV